LTIYISEELLSFSKNTQLILSTHSSRLIRNVLKSNADSSIFHVFADRQYTNIKKMNTIEDKKEKYRITEKEANYYFSKFILFVEGESELQLFQNEILLKLFPDLRNIDIAPGCSNDVILNLSLPTKRNTNIPYVLLLDLDKIIAHNKMTNKFSIRHRIKINPLSSENDKLHEREKFFYGSKRFRTYNNRKRINAIVNECKFHFDKNWFYINDDLFFELKEVIHEYSLEYNVFTLDTTIEGVIINIENYSIFYEWLMQWEDKTSKRGLIQEILNVDFIEEIYLPFYKLTILRLLFKGKYDNLNNIVNVKDETTDKYDIDEYAKNIYAKIADIGPSKKTNGWIDDFLDYFYKNYIKDLKTRDEKKKTFRKYFPELYSILKKITNYAFY